MGSGKTHWGRILSEKLDLRFFDLDDQITEHTGKTIPEIFAEQGEEQFRLLEKDLLHIITESHDSFIMACGGGTPCYFNSIEYMNNAGTTVWINTPLDIVFGQLIQEKDQRPLIKDLADEQLKGFITKKFADRSIYYGQADIFVNEHPVQTDDLIKKILHA